MQQTNPTAEGEEAAWWYCHDGQGVSVTKDGKRYYWDEEIADALNALESRVASLEALAGLGEAWLEHQLAATAWNNLPLGAPRDEALAVRTRFHAAAKRFGELADAAIHDQLAGGDAPGSEGEKHG